jgi:hypothetical protein
VASCNAAEAEIKSIPEADSSHASHTCRLSIHVEDKTGVRTSADTRTDLLKLRIRSKQWGIGGFHPNNKESRLETLIVVLLSKIQIG